VLSPRFLNGLKPLFEGIHIVRGPLCLFYPAISFLSTTQNSLSRSFFVYEPGEKNFLCSLALSRAMRIRNSRVVWIGFCCDSCYAQGLLGQSSPTGQALMQSNDDKM
jgi:hypothetical protein